MERDTTTVEQSLISSNYSTQDSLKEVIFLATCGG